eukprot:TRINITY_DN73569_c0_g1_i1.p1 TRINITY_DN73569_c0_g1~~TRINITY_DN73569_c0_g1_i1.p1  ORF type:complete len:390 (+),score=21.49 TRINITY_DN73569_c0_g1_i1:67-1236(+)
MTNSTKRPRLSGSGCNGPALKSLAELAKQTPAAVAHIFDVDVSVSASMEVPEPFQPDLQRWYGLPSDPDGSAALTRARVQTVLGVKNLWTFEHAVFGELRSLRPMVFAAKAALDGLEKTPTCDFCRPLEKTACDPWGRVENAHCITASNASKWAAPVCGVLICREHNRLKFDREQVVGYLEGAVEYLKRAAAYHTSTHYPFICWQNGKEAGGSQPHGHLQMALTSKPYGDQERWLKLLSGFPGGVDAFVAAWLRAHDAAGLLRNVGASSLFAHLSPRNDRELIVVGEVGTEDFATAIFYATRTLIDMLGSSSFNVAIWMPPIAAGAEKTQPTKEGLRPPTPSGLSRAVARVIPRDHPMCGVGIYGAAPISTDPYRVIDAVDRVMAGATL